MFDHLSCGRPTDFPTKYIVPNAILLHSFVPAPVPRNELLPTRFSEDGRPDEKSSEPHKLYLITPIRYNKY